MKFLLIMLCVIQFLVFVISLGCYMITYIIFLCPKWEEKITGVAALGIFV